MLEIDYVRVKDKTSGYHLTLVRSAAEADPDAYQILKQDAVDHNDQPLPPEFPAPSGQKATDNTPKE
jgi:hypothetical protein